MGDIKRMAWPIVLVIAAVFISGCAVSSHGVSDPDAAALTSKRLRTFGSMEEFDEYRDRVRKTAEARKIRWTQLITNGNARSLLAQNDAEPCDPTEADCGESLQEAVVTAHRRSSTSITNNQESDVDEGDIVKLYDHFLIVLQDGRLFSLDIGSQPGTLRLIDRIDVYPSADTETWYDELLIDGDRLVVTGYNYEQEATEINVISIDAAGELELQARYFVESEDYYSGENYASRLVRGKFVVYTPVDISGREPLHIPRIRSWTPDAGFSNWIPLFNITDVYRPVQETLSPALHVVSVCDLKLMGSFDCSSRGIVGPWDHEVYVSSKNIYLWIGSDRNSWAHGRRWVDSCPHDADPYSLPALSATVFQMPVESTRVFAAQSIGMPNDQFAFDERDDRLLALLIREPDGCYLDRTDPLVFASIPSSLFRSVPGIVRDDEYTPVPSFAGRGLHNQYSENDLIYGISQGYWSGNEDGRTGSADLVVVPLSRPREFQVLNPSHTVERVELIGSHAVIAGLHGSSDLGISTIELGRSPRIADSRVLPDLKETEGRSHAFNARVKANGSGIFGLPTVYRSKYDASAEEIPSDVQFLKTDSQLRIEPVGELAGQNDTADTYFCEVSCVDWYGNARPIFIDERIFALTGSELIEGRSDAGGIIEIGRLRITGTPERLRSP